MKVVWTTPAKIKLREIFNYYRSIATERVAQKLRGKIIEKSRLLACNPRGGQREFLLEDMPYEYRRLVEGNYKIVYRIERDTVFVVDIWDCRRDPAYTRESFTKTEV